MSKKTLIIEPRDTVIFRDGRPFESMVTHAVTLEFPFPSTIAGGVRTRAGIDTESGCFNADVDEIKKIRSHGTLLAELDADGEIGRFLLPAPADALLMDDQATGNIEAQTRDASLEPDSEEIAVSRYRLLPIDIDKALTDFPGDLKPVGHTSAGIAGKPYGSLRYWYGEEFINWLEAPPEADIVANVQELGIAALETDTRMHVAIDSDSMTSDDGMLFQTRGLDFRREVKGGFALKQLALATFVDQETAERLATKPALIPLGGERRLVRWRESSAQSMLFACPDTIRQKITESGHCRIVFLTPAYFDGGYVPERKGDFEVKAIACNRYQTVSGWDFAAKKPKKTARLLPAGSVLFVKVKAADINDWINRNWFNCISDSRDDLNFAHDGFGLAVLGTWDGNCVKEWR